MDPLSISASIITVLQLTKDVIEYLDDVKDAPKERGRLSVEVTDLYALLNNLKYRIEEGRSNEPWFSAIRLLNTQNGPLDQYHAVLVELKGKVVDFSRAGKLIHALVWNFKKAEVERMLARMERLKSLIQIGLDMDHL